MAIEYPPYVNGYGGIPKLFAAIREATVPAKFTQDFLNDYLNLKSSSYRAMIPLMKRLGFIDQANVPTQAYRDVRDPALAGRVMAERLKEAYRILFSASEYANKLEKPTLLSKLRAVLGAGEDDANIQYVAGTFMELSKLANWDGGTPPTPTPTPSTHTPATDTVARNASSGKLGLSYTINLNLPATTEIEVFNAIFKSLREHLLGGL